MPKTDDIFEAARLAKEKRKAMAQKDARKKWLADHIVELLALIVAAIALFRTL